MPVSQVAVLEFSASVSERIKATKARQSSYVAYVYTMMSTASSSCKLSYPDSLSWL